MDIDKLIKEATLSKQSAAKEVYRAIKAEFLLNNSSKNPKSEGKVINTFYLLPLEFINEGLDSEHKTKIEMTELDLSIIRKLIKEREEQISMYEANSRTELANVYKEQLKLLKQFLPPEIPEEDIKKAIKELYPNGFTKKEMGSLIKSLKETFPTADNKTISEIVKTCLNETV